MFMNTENCNTNEVYRIKLHFVDRTDLKNSNKNITFINLSIHCT